MVAGHRQPIRARQRRYYDDPRACALRAWSRAYRSARGPDAGRAAPHPRRGRATVRSTGRRDRRDRRHYQPSVNRLRRQTAIAVSPSPTPSARGACDATAAFRARRPHRPTDDDTRRGDMLPAPRPLTEAEAALLQAMAAASEGEQRRTGDGARHRRLDGAQAAGGDPREARRRGGRPRADRRRTRAHAAVSPQPQRAHQESSRRKDDAGRLGR